MIVVLPRALQRFADGHARVEVEVDDNGQSQPTVMSVLTALASRHPGVADRALDEQGQMRRHVNVFVDGESVRAAGGLATAVHDGSEIVILPAVSGG